MSNSRRAFVLLVVAAMAACDGNETPVQDFDGVVNVGVLHSRSGSMAISENTVAEAELMAIAEINRDGGITIGGKRLRLQPIEEDGASDPQTFAYRAQQLIDDSQVAVVFGGWTSDSRKAMLPVFEQQDHLLFYPVQYEGQECSRNVFYFGATPNQQVEPGIRWLFDSGSRDFFLIGSDYVYPRTVNAIINAQVASLGGRVAGEQYIPLQPADVAPVIDAIRQALPDGGAIINTINGENNFDFFKQAFAAGLTPENGYSIMSFSLAEEEVSAIGARYLEGSYAVWSYFQSIDTPASRKFTADFKRHYGRHRVTSHPAESAYTMVHLWAKAAETADSTDPARVREALIGIAFDAPHGRVEIHPNHHLTKRAAIGEVQADGMFDIVFDAGVIDPSPWSDLLPDSGGHACDWTTGRSDVDSSGLPDDEPEANHLFEQAESVVPLGPLESLSGDHDIIYAGIYVDKVYSLSLTTKTFSADGFLWLEWSAATQAHIVENQIEPIELVRLVNRIERWDSTFEVATDKPQRVSADRYYQRYRFSSRFLDDANNLQRHPFASLELPIVVEIAPSSMSNKYRSTLLVPHHQQGESLGLAGNLSGYRLDRVSFEPYLHQYSSRFGSWYEPTMAQIRLNIQYTADFRSAFIGRVLPLLVVLCVVLLSPSLAGSMGNLRLAIPSTALLTMVFLQQAYHERLPPMPYLTFLDKLFAASYIIALGLFVLFTWGTNVYFKAPGAEKEQAMRRIDRVDIIFQVSSIALLMFVAVVSWY